MAGFLIGMAFPSQPSYAQYTANFQTNIISGVTSNWAGTYCVGSNTFADTMLIQDSGVLSNSGAIFGYQAGSSNNTAVVSDPGSVWTYSYCDLGYYGAGNSLVISNGAQAGGSNSECQIGFRSGSNNNTALVTGTGSVWSATEFYIGEGGSDNSLVVSNGAELIGDGFIGDGPTSNNSAVVTDPGSVWNCNGELEIDEPGAQLVIKNGGRVNALGGDIGDGLGSNFVFVTGTSSTWSNQGLVYFGGYGSSNQLVISRGGQVIVNGINVGMSSGNDLVLVTDPGSVLSSSGGLELGLGRYSSLVISNGGQAVLSENAYVENAENVLVTGTGSAWSIGGTLSMEEFNSMTISNGALVSDSSALVGDGFSLASNNIVRVADGGVWQNGVLYIGNEGSSNSLVISGGSVSATNLVVGFASSNCNNVVELNSGTLTVTNNGGGVLEVRHGKLVLNSGVLQADTLVITNPCASFSHTGGTLIVGNVVLDPNTFRIVSVSRQSNDLLVTWMMGPGATNTLQATAGDGTGSYSTNSFTDIFVVTNNTTVGTVTNYLDLGAATNKPSRYYRARLLP